MKQFWRPIFILFFCFFALFPAFSFAISTTTSERFAAQICRELDKAVNMYQAGNIEAAQTKVTMTYFQQYDVTLEPGVRANIGGQHVFDIEHQFHALSQAMAQTPTLARVETVRAQAKQLCAQIQADANVIEKNQTNGNGVTTNTNSNSTDNTSTTQFWEALLQSFMLLLREGFEALLIVTALLAYLQRANMQNKSYVVYTGVGSAIGASVITAYLFAAIFKMAGNNREGLEGITLIIAAIVLLYVSYWLFAHGVRKKHALSQRVESALNKGSLFALGLAAFLAVYREGAEIILFYQALVLTHPGPTSALILGFILACFALVGLYFIMRKATVRIPYRLFFGITAIFLYYIAFTFIGTGVFELQGANWISATPLTNLPTISLLGFYPTAENLISQLVFLIPTMLGLVWWYKKQRARVRV